MLRRRILRMLAVLVAVSLPFVALQSPAVRGALVELMGYMRGAGVRGVLAFLAVQTGAALLLTPLWLMSGIAGYVYGFGHGVALALPGTTLAACATFAAGRLLSGGMLARLSASSPRVAAIARVAERQGMKVTFLLRATPVMPQNLLGYALAATPLRFSQFAIGTTVGLIPATLMHVYIGSIVDDALALVSGNSEVPGVLSWVFFGGGAVLTITMMTLMARIARRELEKALAEGAGPPT